VIKKLLCTAFLSLALFTAAVTAQEAAPSPPAGVAASAAQVDGLELPADQTVNFDEGFVNIQAKCKGEVKWLVISGTKVKFVPVPASNSIIISIPPQGGVVTVFAVGLVDGKITEFARTNITVQNGPPGPGPGPAPGPGPGPTPGPVAGPLHFTFLVDLNATTPELAQVLNSQNVRQAITSKQSFFRLYDIKSPIVSQKKLDAVVQRVGGNAVVVVQRNDGYVVGAYAMPKTETEVIALINRSFGG